MELNTTRMARRDLLRRGAATAVTLVSLDMLAACGAAPAATLSSASPTPRITPTATPLPAPETTTIRITGSPCDAPIMAAGRFLREEGFTDIQITDAGVIAALAGGKADLGSAFVTQLATAVDTGKPVIGLSGIHAGCAEIWAPMTVSALSDLRGRTVIVVAKTADNLAYTFLAIALKNAGIDPKDVNFVAQADVDTAKAYLDGKSDAVFVATTGAVAMHANPANKGHVIIDQAMDKPWSEQDCCILCANSDWARANPIAAKRAVRAVTRAADSLGTDRADAAKLATDMGLFGGSKNYEPVRAAANMVSLDWRSLDPARSLRFHAGLMSQVGLLKISAEDAATRGTDLRILGELR
jgi:NitT/TauT family transport system substrate-binding protein